MKFYFTFGLVNQPFTGGWVVINADSRAQACMLFRAAFQPNDEMLNCCSTMKRESLKEQRCTEKMITSVVHVIANWA